MIYLQLFWEFFQIGLFAVGGGMATLPFLQRLAVRTGWYSQALITDMVAVSESTPGPIGINMATYVGYTVAGPLGGLCATLGEAMPSVLLVIFVAGWLRRERNARLMERAFYGMRPAVTGLIAAAGWSVMRLALFNAGAFAGAFSFGWFNWWKLGGFALAFLAVRKWKLHPVACIACGAAVGVAAALLL